VNLAGVLEEGERGSSGATKLQKKKEKKKKQCLVFIMFILGLLSDRSIEPFYVSLSICENASIFCNIAFLAIDGYFFCFFPFFFLFSILIQVFLLDCIKHIMTRPFD